MVFNGGSEAVKHITEWKFVPLFYTPWLRLGLRCTGLCAFCRRGGIVEEKPRGVLWYVRRPRPSQTSGGAMRGPGSESSLAAALRESEATIVTA